jgi:phosphoglucosamine mutase
MKLFGTDGVRGTYGNFPMDNTTIKKIGFALSKILDKNIKNIYIAHDGRESFELVYKNLLEGIFFEKAYSIKYIGMLPTPALPFILSNNISKDSIGIQITASHNPYYDNGIKIFDYNGSKISIDKEKAIEEIVNSQDNFQNKIICDFNVDQLSVDLYINYLSEELTKNIKFKKKLNIALDCSNGAVSNIFKSLTVPKNVSFILLNCSPNGKNINYNCGAVYPENLSQFIKDTNGNYNKNNNEWIDFGIAFDGDGDRTILISDSGKIIDGDEILYILSTYNFPSTSTIVGTVMTNYGIRTSLDKLGYNFIETAVGDKNVLEGIIQHNAKIGSESSGHVIHTDSNIIPIGDAIITLIRIIHLLEASNSTIEQLYPKSLKIPSELINITATDKESWIKNNFTNIKKVEEILNEDGRILIRESGTQPLLRILIEHRSENTLSKVKEIINNII